MTDTPHAADGGQPIVRFTRPSHAPGLELARYPSLTRGWQGIPDGYTWFTLIDWLEGAVDLTSRGVTGQCAAGSVTVGAPGEPYVLRPRSPMRGHFRVIRVDDALLDTRLDDIGAEMDVRRPADLFPREPQYDVTLARTFRRLYRASDGGDALETQERLFALLAALTERGRDGRASPQRRGPSPGVRRAQELLHARFAETLSLNELAAAAGTGTFALLRAFSYDLGLTPHAYQVQLRMARARRLIAGREPLADVALAVGYSEQSALNRAFKRHVGVTPGAYMHAAR